MALLPLNPGRPRARPPLIARLHAPGVQHRAAVIVPVVLVLAFLATVAFLRGFHPEGAGFEAAGFALVLYHVARLGLALFLAVLCYVAGYRALEVCRWSPPALFTGIREAFILCFFYGASLYGLVFTILGLMGQISLAAGLVATVPVLVLAYRPITALLTWRSPAATSAWTDTHASPVVVRAVTLAAIAAMVLFVLTRVVFVANVDPNVWEHYLHYYRAVLASGSTQPNEVWHHFYSSKGGGLVFLANVLGDFFGVQLVSFCMVAVAGLIILDLLLGACGSASWAGFGVILFFTYLYGDVSSGSMFRVHGVLLGYASFALWGCVWLQRATGRPFQAVMLALVVSFIYVGFYLPVAAGLLSAAFVLFALANALLREPTRAAALLVLIAALGAGSAAALATNWVLTGLPEVTPMRWFWAIADQDKVRQVFGTGGVDFFLAVNNDLEPGVSWSRRLRYTIRYPVPEPGMWASLVALLVVVSALVKRRRAQGSVARADALLGQLVAFLIPLAVFVLLVPSPSVYRMGLFSLVFTTAAVVVIWKRFVDLSLGGLRLSLLSVEADDRGAPVRLTFRLWQAATAVIIVTGVAYAFTDATKNLGKHGPLVYAYAFGALSLHDALEEMETQGGRSPGPSVAAITEFRRTAGPTGRILSLGYEPGYAYALPGDGMVSEPTYALVRSPQRLIADNAGAVAAYVRERQITHLAVNVKARLFSTIAFTALFDPREMAHHLGVVYEDGDFFILAWRQYEQTRPLPEYLVAVLELKRTGALHHPFTETFAARLTTGDRLVESVAGFDQARNEFRSDLERVLNTEVLPRLSGEAARTQLRRILGTGISEVGRADPGEVLETRRSASGYFRIRVAERELKARLLKLFQTAIHKEYVAEFGIELAALSLYCDERVPFGPDRPPEATCSTNVRPRGRQDAARVGGR